MAFFRRGRPRVGLYWLHSTRPRASRAAARMKSGGVVAEEALAHVDDGLVRGGGGGLVYDGPLKCE